MRKAVKIAVVLVLVVICIVVTAGFVIRSGKKGNPSPESINMGSAGSMGPMPPAAHTTETVLAGDFASLLSGCSDASPSCGLTTERCRGRRFGSPRAIMSM